MHTRSSGLLAPALLLAAALLVGCASTPAYGPAERAGAFGYRDQPIEQGRYRVSYTARTLPAAEDGALRRSADLAIQNGYDWFTIVNRAAQSEGARRGGSSIGIGGGTGGRGGGVGLGVSLPLGGGSASETTVNLEVLMGDGRKPEGPQSYDARSVLTNVVERS